MTNAKGGTLRKRRLGLRLHANMLQNDWHQILLRKRVSIANQLSMSNIRIGSLSSICNLSGTSNFLLMMHMLPTGPIVV